MNMKQSWSSLWWDQAANECCALPRAVSTIRWPQPNRWKGSIEFGRNINHCEAQLNYRKKDKHMLKWADTHYVELGWIICWTDVLNILAGHIADSDSSLTSIIGILSSSAPRVKKISLEAFSFSATWPWPQQWVTSQDISGCFRHGH